jgi:hypothetical protein
LEHFSKIVHWGPLLRLIKVQVLHRHVCVIMNKCMRGECDSQMGENGCILEGGVAKE